MLTDHTYTRPYPPSNPNPNPNPAVFMLADHTGLGVDMARYLRAVEHLQQARVGRRGARHTADLAERKGQQKGISRSAELQISGVPGFRLEWRTLTPSLSCSPP